MDIIYALAGIILMLFTCFIAWVNWKILRVSEKLLAVSIILLDETIIIRKDLQTQKTPLIQNKPILGKKS